MKYNKDLVDKYIEMVSDWDNPNFIFDKIDKLLHNNAKILELGSGTGKDYQKLSEKYEVVGSDYSESFLEVLGENFLHIDARNFKLNIKFDMVYSNKVLHHLSIDELASSLQSQYNVLKEDGYVVMTLWYGNSTKEHDGLVSYYYNESHLDQVKGDFNLVEVVKYKEMDFSEGDDSFLVIMQK